MNSWDLAAWAACLTISFQPAWKVRRHSGCSRLRIPAFWWQKWQVPAADFRRLERGMVHVSLLLQPDEILWMSSVIWAALMDRFVMV